MRTFSILFFLGLSLVSLGQSKTVDRKNKVFIYWGYNRSAYTKSDFHIQGDGYDFTVKDLRATDKPTPFSTEDYIKPANISKPQYNYRIGYYLNDRLSISVGMDHMKYFMVSNQEAILDGYISQEASADFAGSYDNQKMTIPWKMLYFHHSDGLNYASLELEYNFPLWISVDQKHYVDGLANVGGGIVVPKTYVKIFEEEEDNVFHVAGGGPSAKLGLRATFWRYVFFEVAGKAGYVWMPNILVNSEGNAQADQQFGWIEFYGALGFNIPLSKQKK